MASSWGTSWGTSWGNSWGASVAPVVDDISGRYRPIPLWRRKRRKDELEELIERLQAVAAGFIPAPPKLETPPVIYNKPLVGALFEAKQIQTVKKLISRARADAEFEQLLKQQLEDDDEDSAILLLLH